MESGETNSGAAAGYAESAVQRAARRDHINNVYRVVFEKLDSDEVRAARHYVYEMDKIPDGSGGLVDRKGKDVSSLTYQNERWLELDAMGASVPEEWRKNRTKAEKIARALDQLGFLVREGIVPVNIIARFYTYPALKCWYKLCPYIHEIRTKRDQKGHMWEWENLVQMIIDKTGDGNGVWKGSRHHDNLDNIIDQIEVRKRALNLLRDEKWKPPDRSWADE
jgi:hypothetical protein